MNELDMHHSVAPWGAALAAVLTMMLPSASPAQTVHQVPFASGGNTVELLLENPTESGISELTIRLTESPAWIGVTQAEQSLGGVLLPGKPGMASWTFAVDPSAPIGRIDSLVFSISSASEERWTKSISISVLPPERFELRQNYPNPFNPATTITFLLPRSSEVSLIVYTLLGEEVATLIRGTLEPGYHEALWDASAMASGVYLYRLTTPRTVLTGRMMLIR